MRTLVFEPLVPIGLWVTLALAACALVVFYAISLRGRLPWRRSALILSLMGLAVALPLALLLNPQWIERLPPPAGKPVLTLLIDGSASMATPDARDGQTRFAAANDTARALADRLGDRFEIEPKMFSTSSRPLDLSADSPAVPDGAHTDLAAAIDQALTADCPQGQALLLLSDGIHNAGGGQARVLASARRAKAMAAPIYTQAIGGRSAVRDLSVEVRSPQELAFVGQKIPLRAVLEPKGLAGAKAQLVLALDDKPLERRDVAFDADNPLDIEFSVGHDQSGVYRYEVHVDPLAGEVTAANNSATFLLRVVDEPVRVVLVEGKPYWDTKFLLRTLAADPSLELVSVVRLADERLLERTLARPKPAQAEAAKPVATQSQTAQSDSTEPESDKAQSDQPNKPDQSKADSVGIPPKDATRPEPDGENAAKNPAHNSGQPAEGRSEQWKIVSSAGDILADAGRLRGFQIVVLGRDAETFLTDPALECLKRWITRDGGSLVCFRGAPASQINERLAQMLPIRWDAARETRFHVKWTDDGRALGWLGAAGDNANAVTQLPTLATHATPGRLQPLATVLAVGDLAAVGESPVVSTLPFGTGRVVAVEGAGMWRWAFLPPQYREHEQVYSALWHSLTRWLVSNTGLLPSQTWALRSDKIRFDSSEEATLSLLVRPDALAAGVPTVELSGPALPAAKSLAPVPTGDDPGAFRIACGRLPAGRYTAQIAGAAAGDAAARTVFDVRESVDELVNLDADGNLLKRVAEASGGLPLDMATPDRVAAELDKQLAANRPEQIRTDTAWDRWWVLVAMFGVWGLAWGVRRHSGLI